MCGIAGLYYADQRPIAQSVLDRMTDSLAHRGPDGRGTWQVAGVGLGHRRLAIRDLTQDGAQPMLSADGQVVVVFNGEIYNDQLLRGELTAQFGARFTSTADTAIIAPGWQAWGEQLFARLEGCLPSPCGMCASNS
jgi:asparagine synthase (glutamine-hydrolysing)